MKFPTNIPTLPVKFYRKSFKKISITILKRNIYFLQENADSLPFIVGITPFSILDLNVKEQALSSVMNIALYWTNERLTWNTTIYNQTKILLPVENFWIPEILFPNA